MVKDNKLKKYNGGISKSRGPVEEEKSDLRDDDFFEEKESDRTIQKYL